MRLVALKLGSFRARSIGAGSVRGGVVRSVAASRRRGRRSQHQHPATGGPRRSRCSAVRLAESLIAAHCTLRSRSLVARDKLRAAAI